MTWDFYQGMYTKISMFQPQHEHLLKILDVVQGRIYSLNLVLELYAPFTPMYL